MTATALDRSSFHFHSLFLCFLIAHHTDRDPFTETEYTQRARECTVTFVYTYASDLLVSLGSLSISPVSLLYILYNIKNYALVVSGNNIYLCIYILYIYTHIIVYVGARYLQS